MPKSKVFIIWNDKEIADKVSQFLSSKGYEGIVGGSKRDQNGNTIYESVIHGMDECDQAIAIMRNIDKSNRISANVFLELGYALSRYGKQKTHMYYIDYDLVNIPSDLSGVWTDDVIKTGDLTSERTAESRAKIEDLLKCADLQDDVRNYIINSCLEKENRTLVIDYIAQRIVQSFLKHQVITIRIPKIVIVSNYYHYRQYLIEHLQTPHCSDYELAQYLLFLIQGAYIHDDLDDFKKYLDILANPIDRHLLSDLKISIKFAQLSVDFYQKIFSHNISNLGGKENCINSIQNAWKRLSCYLTTEGTAEDKGDHEETPFNDRIYIRIMERIDGLKSSICKQYNIVDISDPDNIVDNSDPVSASKGNRSCYRDYLFWLCASVLQMEIFGKTLYIMRGQSDNTDEKKAVYHEVKNTADSCLKLLAQLEGEIVDKNVSQNDEDVIQTGKNSLFAALFFGYINRNMHEATEYMRSNKLIDENDLPDTVELYLTPALEKRKTLWQYSTTKPVTDMFEKQMEMEYYLALSRLISYKAHYASELDESRFYLFINNTLSRLLRKGQYMREIDTILDKL